MHKAVLLSAVVVLFTAGGAQAQAPGAPYPAPQGSMGMQRPPLPPAPVAPPASRWGSQVGGRWWGGTNAPGGWAAYRQPRRGWRVPAYWVAPRFYVTDWSRYGLYAPTSGYNWVRYYDDAVLVDGGGNVSDWRGGLDWDGAAYAYDDHGGGAAIDGAGGYAIGRSIGRGRRGPAPGWRDDGRGGPPPEWRGDGYPPLPPGHPPIGPYPPHGGASTWTSPDGRTTVTTVTTGGGYGAAPVIVAGGGYYGGATTVTVQGAPVVTTTTTTETIEDVVTYRRAAVRHRVWHARPRCVCPPVRRVRHARRR